MRATRTSLSGQGIGGELRRLLCARRTSVDSDQVDLLFERFISKERLEPPDIRRRFRAFAPRGGDAICLSPLWPPSRRDHRDRHPYRPRSAIRDVGKALG